MMNDQQKLDFVLKMTKHALQHVQHFDSGGTALSGPTSVGTQNATNPNTSGIAGTLNNVIGTNNNFQASGVPIQQGTNVNQLNAAYTGAQNALGQANNLTNTLTPGVSQGANTQNTLTQQLQSEALGQGPNPALNELNQNTGQNIAQAAALAASTRGAGTNAGLVASNAANTATNTQQQAIGQAATNESTQQLNAQNALQNLAATQVNQGTNAVQLGNQAQQNEQNILQGANTAANNAAVSQQENINNTNAAVAAGNQNSAQNTAQGIGSALNASGAISAIGSLFAEGGKVPSHFREMANIYHPHLADGGMIWQNSTPVSSEINPGAAPNLPSYTGPSLSSIFQGSKGSKGSSSPGTTASGVGGSYGLGGQGMVNDLGQNSVGAAPLTSDSLTMPELGSGAGLGAASKAPALLALAVSKGGKVPGKPKVNHDAYSNDTVDAKLTPGEVVLDLDTLHDKGKLGKMARFVAKEIERRKAGRKV